MVVGDSEDVWVRIECGVYRYAATRPSGQTLARIVIREYLAACCPASTIFASALPQ